MIAHGIKKESRTLKERGLNHDSFFTAHFKDESQINEMETNWSDVSEQKVCDYFGGKKTVAVCVHPIKKLHVKHGDMEHEIEVPEGCEVYQAIRAETSFLNNGERKVRTLGRVVGLVKDGKVIEEYFLNEIEGKVHGVRA